MLPSTKNEIASQVNQMTESLEQKKRHLEKIKTTTTTKYIYTQVMLSKAPTH